MLTTTPLTPERYYNVTHNTLNHLPPPPPNPRNQSRIGEQSLIIKQTIRCQEDRARDLEWWHTPDGSSRLEKAVLPPFTGTQSRTLRKAVLSIAETIADKLFTSALIGPKVCRRYLLNRPMPAPQDRQRISAQAVSSCRCYPLITNLPDIVFL